MLTTLTTVYFVRHADSAFVPNREWERGLTEQGERDAGRIVDILGKETLDHFVSSPYERAIATIRGLAALHKQEIQLVEDLREREIGVITGIDFKTAKKQVYADFDHAFAGGESSKQAQKRAVEALKVIIGQHRGKRIVVGTHGDILTLMLNFYNPQYGYSFWTTSTMPDIYKVQFDGEILERIEHVWR